jgi:aspartyl/glutamyl-tRNA(Asn/Gln) amidotransferase C subunit
MLITSQMVDKAAKLAHLLLTTQEKEWFQKELQSIFDYMQLLNEFPVDFEENLPVDQETHVRADIAVHTSVMQSLLDQAPQAINQMFVVPRVLEKD